MKITLTDSTLTDDRITLKHNITIDYFGDDNIYQLADKIIEYIKRMEDRQKTDTKKISKAY